MSDRKKIAKRVAKKFSSRLKTAYPDGLDQWYMNKEAAPLEGTMGVNDNLPVGGTPHPLDRIEFKDKHKDQDKPDKEISQSNKNTVEMMLLQSDLSSDQVGQAMEILSNKNMKGFYSYLRKRGLYNEPLVIKQVLNHYSNTGIGSF